MKHAPSPHNSCMSVTQVFALLALLCWSCHSFIAHINDGYLSTNSYHNAAHAGNVVWAMQHWMSNSPALHQMTAVQCVCSCVFFCVRVSACVCVCVWCVLFVGAMVLTDSCVVLI